MRGWSAAPPAGRGWEAVWPAKCLVLPGAWLVGKWDVHPQDQGLAVVRREGRGARTPGSRGRSLNPGPSLDSGTGVGDTGSPERQPFIGTQAPARVFRWKEPERGSRAQGCRPQGQPTGEGGTYLGGGFQPLHRDADESTFYIAIEDAAIQLRNIHEAGPAPHRPRTRTFSRIFNSVPITYFFFPKRRW